MSQLPPPMPKLCTNCVRTVNLAFIILATFLTVGLAMCFILVVPRFQSIFADMGSKLPAVTRLVMFMACWPGIMVTVGILCLLIAAMIVGYRVLPWPTGNIISAAVVVILLSLAALLVVGLFAPLFMLITSMQGG
jgi:hypothetical protein